jgi:hypothetical protein
MKRRLRLILFTISVDPGRWLDMFLLAASSFSDPLSVRSVVIRGLSLLRKEDL